MVKRTMFDLYNELEFSREGIDALGHFKKEFSQYKGEEIDWTPLIKSIKGKLEPTQYCDFWEIYQLPWKIGEQDSWDDLYILDAVFMQLAETLTFRVQRDLFVASEFVKSPIEKYLLLAMLMYGYVNADGVIMHLEGVPFGKVRYPNLSILHITPQAQVGPYYVDFKLGWVQTHHELFSQKDISSFSQPVRQAEKVILVECDSYDYHDGNRTLMKLDRERKRVLEMGGYKLLSFAGQEIWKDALKCAKEVIDYLAETLDKDIYRDESDTREIPF